MNIKNIAIKFVFFLAGISIIFTITLLMAIGSKDNWQYGLEKQLVSIMEQKYLSRFTINGFISVNSSISTSLAIYKLDATDIKKDSDIFYGIIIRIPTFYGPQNAVYIYSQENKCEFIGIAGLNPNIKKEALILTSLENSFQVKRLFNRISIIMEEILKDDDLVKENKNEK